MWFVRVSGGALDRSEQVAFERWYADAGNAAAYASVERSWQVAGAVGPQAGAIEDERLGGMIAAARQAGAPRRRRPAWRSIAAAGLLVVVGGMLWWQGGEIARPLQDDAPVVAASSPESYVTAVGERSTITLGDGSQVSLNTDSRLRVSFTADRRQVTLLAGQALFEVAPDSVRPFEVAAAGHRVVALGTAFDVRVGDRGL